jgi:hypothetical protein
MICKNVLHTIASAGLFLVCVAHGTIGGDLVFRVDWSYEVAFWIESLVSPKYAVCGSGMHQSLVDIPVQPPFVVGRPSIQLHTSHLTSKLRQ